MMSWWKGYRGVAVVFWLLTVATVLFFISDPADRSGWDMRVYGSAIASLRAGHDPYLDGMAVQHESHDHLASHPHADLPYTYIYSPLTLPLLRWVGVLPLRVSGGLYWLLYVAGVVSLVWVWMQALEEKERAAFALFAPAALFFPGLLLEDDVLFSGNIAYIFYGLIFAMAVMGWRRGRWGWFYVAVVGASCFKLPMLTLLAIPLVSARRQWFRASVAAAMGVALFVGQRWVWPGEFEHYMEAVRLEFLYNHGFGTSLAGVAANAMYGVVSSPTIGGLVYLSYAVPVAGVLLYLSRRFHAGDFSVERWMPVVLVGSLLLNPRLMEYDVAAIALPMGLIVCRVFVRGAGTRRALFGVGFFFLCINAVALRAWKPVEAAVLVGVFGLGCWELWSRRGSSESREWRISASEAVSEG